MRPLGGGVEAAADTLIGQEGRPVGIRYHNVRNRAAFTTLGDVSFTFKE